MFVESLVKQGILSSESLAELHWQIPQGFDFETGIQEITDLLEEYSEIVLSDDYNYEEEDQLDGPGYCHKENRERVRGFNKRYRAKRRHQ